MKLRILGLTLVIVMLTGISAQAFNGQRKGFILGGGLGFGMTSYTQTLKQGSISITSERENKGAFNTNFQIGYAPSDQVAIYYVSKVAWFSMTNAYDDEVTIASGAGGLGLSYYQKPVAPSLIFTGGIAVSSWALPFEDDAPDPWQGFGIYGGIGYEFARHVSAELDLVYGKPDTKEDGVTASANVISVMFTINALAF
jgi:hypothetical protein